MNLTVSHCFITVDDQDQALQFYRDVLGLKVVNDVAFDGLRWVSLSPARAAGGRDRPPGPGAVPGHLPGRPGRDGRAGGQGPAAPALIFATDDCDATFEQLRAAGAEVMQEPIDQPYGVRDCAFRDPAGNMLRFSQSKRS